MRDRLKDILWFYGFLATIGLVLLISLSIALRKDSGWWAAWGQWVGGAGSIAAAGAAVWIAVVGWQKSDKKTEEQNRRFEYAQEREHASNFAFWVHWTEERQVVVMYHNGAPLPMYEVLMQLIIDERPAGPWIDIGTVGPTTEPREHGNATGAMRQALKIVLDNLAERAGQPDSPFRSIPIQEEMSERLRIMSSASVITRFRDTNNRRWIREANGQLLPQTDSAD